jgi:hypothetical protein
MIVSSHSRQFKRRIAGVVALFCIFLLTSAAHALIRGPNPPSFQSHTVEAITADSPLIVTATVVSSRIGPYDWQATFATGEILKSPPGYAVVPKFDASLDFFRTSYRYLEGDERQFQFPPIGARVLLFLGDGGKLNDCVLLDAPEPARSMLSPHAFDLTLTNIRDNQTLLSIVKAELQRVPPTAATRDYFVWPFPNEYLPDDARVLPAARRWVHSNDPFARLLGATVLQDINDPQDIEALQSLLNDPSVTDHPVLSPWSGRSYLVRAAAWWGLQARHVVLPPPVVDLPRPGVYEPVSWFWPMLLLAGPWLPYTAWRFWRRRRRQPRIRFWRLLTNSVMWACLIYAVESAPFWLRSRHTADDVVWARFGLVANFGSVQGGLYLQCSSSWPAQTPLVRAAITPKPDEPDPSRREDNFWHRFGCWDIDDTLWSRYAYNWPPEVRIIGAGTVEDRFPFPWPKTSPFPPSKGIVAACSYLCLILLLLSFPALRLLAYLARRIYRAWQASRDARRGLCAKCSYDLRAHKPGDRCPECGEFIAYAPDGVIH